jgi:putative glutamine amidotransferase
MRPLIGVTSSELRPSTLSTARRHGEPPLPEMALGMSYVRTLDAAGAMPVVLPPVGAERVAELVARLDGVVLSGGPDLDPALYGATERHAELGSTEPSLDYFELELLRAAMAAELPILAICRGAQALNVACGGTLYQHVPEHRQDKAASLTSHAVTLEERSRLATVLGAGEQHVNSFHHQVIDRVGDGLNVVARADDGAIEAVEGPGFTIGVQWHAETLTQQLPLFQALVAAASGADRRVAAA